MTLAPLALAVALLIDVNRRPVRATEEMLQSAVLAEIAGSVTRLILDVQSDAVASAAIFGRAVDGALRDEDAVESVRGLIATRGQIEAVRLEVPEAGLGTVIRKAGAAADPPEGTPELRRIADERGVAFGVTGPGRGLVVARVRASAGDAGAGPKGYVVAAIDLRPLARDLARIAARRFEGRDVGLLIATRDRVAVASFGVEAALPGADVSRLSIWAIVPPAALGAGQVSVVGEHVEAGRPMIGAVETVPDLGLAVAIWRPEPVALAAIHGMERRGLAVAAASVLLALAVGFLAAGRVTRPILELVAQARLIGQRRWREVSLEPSSRDEIGELTGSLGRMAEDLEQGEAEIAHEAKLRGDLGRFMDKALVEAIVRGEHPLALGGKRTAVSVLFADVVGFTPLAESRDAERVVALLNELFSMLTEIVFRHGGTVDKFIGDCIMAVWGAPVAQEDHARRALAAAEDMMRFLETANEEWREKYDVEIRLGVGVNSGEAIVGNVGSNKRMEYTVIGDVVNVASRLEAIAAPNQVLVSEATQALVGEAFPLRYLGEQNLTGRKAKTQVYALEQD
ncbi:MAG: adenylate/guanylate cyclase domain-containing protein [Polyangiaceae bacterium]|nr:adenylate/guanylate cyclase domain-containing protein [Polyangiaceae bacterium]